MLLKEQVNIMGFRLEEKIKFHISDYSKLKNEIFKIGGNKLFPKRVVSSIYLDNKNLDMFLDSEDGNVPRKKIRLRTYPNAKEKFLFKEIKITSVEGKFKKSEKINVKDFNSINQIFFDSYYGFLEKKIIIAYTREYFLIEGVRLTLDYNICYSTPDENYKQSDFESLILEVKSTKNILDVHNKFLNLIPIRRERFTKYCEGINLLYNKNYFQRINTAI